MMVLTLPSRLVHDGWWFHNLASQVRYSMELKNPITRYHGMQVIFRKTGLRGTLMHVEMIISYLSPDVPVSH